MRTLASIVFFLGVWLGGGAFYGAAWAQPAQACDTTASQQRLLSCADESPLPAQLLAEPLQGEPRWLALRLHSPAAMQRLLGLGVPDAEMLQVWHLRPGQREPQRIVALGALAPFSERPLATPRLVLPLQLEAGEHRLWLAYRLHGNGRLAPRLLSLEAAHQLAMGTMLGLGFMAGSLLMLMLGVLSVRMMGGSSGYGAYTVLVVSELVLVGQIEGYWFAFLWPEQAGWNQLAPTLMALGTLAAHAGFALRFLQLRERAPGLRRLHLLLLALLLVAALLTLLGLPTVEAVGAMTLLYVPLALATALQAWRRGVLGAPLYLLGTLSLAFWGFVLFTLSVLGLNPFPTVDFFVYPKIGLLLESGCFAAALINRLRLQRQQLADQRLRRLAETEQLLALEAQKRAALELAQLQGLRLAGASHDISQPLASLRFAIEALRAHEAPAAITGHLDRTLQYAQTLLADLITQTRDELPTQADRIELGPWLQELLGTHQAQARAKGLELRAAPSRVVLEGSRLMLTRIVGNLLVNALRYTRRGGVLVGVRRRPGALEIQVCDSGPGLLPSELARLQRPFVRGMQQQGSEGHGLGLFIVKSLCAEAGYGFTVRSQPGRGSVFAITVPAVSA